MRKQLYFWVLFLFLIPGFVNCYAQWNKSYIPWENVESNSPLGITAFAEIGNKIFVSRELFPLYYSTDNGFTWNWLNGAPFDAITVRGNNMFGGINALYESTDFGKTWSILNQHNLLFGITSIAVNDSNIYVGTFYNGLWTSNDNGTSFVRDSSGLYQSNSVNTILISDTNVLAGTSNSGIYLSANNGKSWKQSNNGLANLDVHSLISNFGNILAGTDNGVFLSSDNGSSWIQVNNGLTDDTVYSFAWVANYVFCGTNNGGIFATTNYGGNWTPIADSLTSYNISALALSGNNILAGSSNGSLWYRTVANMFTTGVNDKPNNVPDKYSLYQNYPNPFNPTTTISYELPKSSFVTLKVYDIIGREITTLVNEQKNAGTYQAKFDGSRFASGVYFYRLQAGTFTLVKKFVLMK